MKNRDGAPNPEPSRSEHIEYRQKLLGEIKKLESRRKTDKSTHFGSVVPGSHEIDSFPMGAQLEGRDLDYCYQELERINRLLGLEPDSKETAEG